MLLLCHSDQFFENIFRKLITYLSCPIKDSLLGVDILLMIAGLFRQIGGHGSRFVLFCSF